MKARSVVLPGVVVLGLLLLPAAGGAQTDAYEPYQTLLAHQCPAKHLEWLSPAALNDMIELNFRESLRSNQWIKVTRASDAKAACAKTIGGATCENTAYLRGMSKLSLLPKFVKLVCNSGLVCHGQSECRKP